ncbi:hypothetical protein DKX38_017353 [Salix brachista]|uniref:Vta1/callose synthase N-terminal domain-containing protein n=1 Tax=Salix brachista TaxID=2182728 RepID=A0A5N5KV33_9ROSI|nr:hypothetical protein DKX38_017353 [Salix brachista]
MGSENEPAKLLLPYLQRADELQKHEALVAYYCRLYAMEKGLRIPQNERTKTTNSLLISLMKQLEKDKKSLKLGPEDNLYLEGFALNVFGKADKQDRAGRADLSTAKTFYAASIFFEIITQFGELQPDLEQKQKYAVWKAADIRKALKEGRKPNPGPPVDDENLSIPSSTPSGVYDLGRSESAASNAHPESDPSPQFHDQVNDEQYTNIPPSPLFHDKVNNNHTAHIPPPSLFYDSASNQRSTDTPPPSYPTAGYPSHDFHPPPPASRSENSAYAHPPPPASRSENSAYAQPYHQQSNLQEPPYHQQSNLQEPPYHQQSNLQEPQPHQPHNYQSHETSSYSYPNFQSYPSFSESSLPSVPSHHPSYYQGSDPSHIPQSAPPTSSYSSTPQYPSSSIKRTNSDPAPTPAKTYQYDSNYCPPPDKIAEAHKAARFAVGALAFDDVSVAVDYLRKSLELLTNPSVGQ